MPEDERDIHRRLQLRPVFWICPSCSKVIRRTTEAADSPTAVTRTAKEPCRLCYNPRAWQTGGKPPLK